MGLERFDTGGGTMSTPDKWKILNMFIELFSAFSPKAMFTEHGGYAVKYINDTGAPTVKGRIVDASRNVDGAVRLTPVDVPDTIGVMLEDGVAVGDSTWIVIGGPAEVYFPGSVTRGWLARSTITSDGSTAGIALGEAVPTSPFATDKHFCEIGHVMQSRTGAGLALVNTHFN